MAIDWLKNFIIPVIEITFLFGIIGFILFYIFKAFHNVWTKSTKYILKYKILRKSYPEKTVKWIVECIEKGIGYYDAKKLLYLNMKPKEQINETMWVFDQIIYELNKGKSKKNYGGKKDERTQSNLPSL